MKLIIFLIIFLSLNVHGFGVSPSHFDINISEGKSLEKEFFIVNNNDELRTYNISNHGFFNFTNLLVKVEENSQKEVKFLIKIPKETAKGTYNGRIYVKELNKEAGGLNLDKLLGIKFNFNIKSNISRKDMINNLKPETYLSELQDYIPDNEIDVLDDLTSEPELTFFYGLSCLVILLSIFRIFSVLILKK